MLDGLRGTIRALCLEDLMRHPRHSRSQVHSCLKETLDMEAANAQCSVTELSSLLAFDLHCGIPGKVRRVVFNDDHTAALDHAFLYVHLGIHLFCLSTRVQGVIQALQRLQLIDADVLSGVGKPLGGRYPSVWRHPGAQEDASVPLLQALLAHQTALGNVPRDRGCDELLAQAPPQPCMMHNLQGVISHHARHMRDSGLGAVADKLAYLLKLLEPIAAQRAQQGGHQTASHVASQLLVDVRWAKKCAEEMLGEPEEGRSCTMCAALSEDPEAMQAELLRLDAAMEVAVTEFSIVQHMTATLNPQLFYNTAATMTSLLHMPAADAGMVNAEVYKALSLDKRQGTAFLALVSEHSQRLSGQWERLEAVARKDLTDQCILATPCAAAVVHELLGAQEAVNAFESTFGISLPTVDIPPIVFPRERALQLSIAGRVPARLRLRPSGTASPPPGAALSRPGTPQGLPTAGHRVSASVLPTGVETDTQGQQDARQPQQLWDRTLSEMDISDLERLVADPFNPPMDMVRLRPPASQPLRFADSMPQETHGAAAKRRRMDAAEHHRHPPVEHAGSAYPQPSMTALHAAAAAAFGNNRSLREDLLRLNAAAAAQQLGGGAAEAGRGEAQASLYTSEPAGLVDLDQVQTDIAALDARLCSQLLLDVLTPWQAASFLTQAFPYLADRHGLADLVRADLKFKRSLGQ